MELASSVPQAAPQQPPCLLGWGHLCSAALTYSHENAAAAPTKTSPGLCGPLPVSGMRLILSRQRETEARSRTANTWAEPGSGPRGVLPASLPPCSQGVSSAGGPLAGWEPSCLMCTQTLPEGHSHRTHPWLMRTLTCPCKGAGRDASPDGPPPWPLTARLQLTGPPSLFLYLHFQLKNHTRGRNMLHAGYILTPETSRAPGSGPVPDPGRPSRSRAPSPAQDPLRTRRQGLGGEEPALPGRGHWPVSHLPVQDRP